MLTTNTNFDSYHSNQYKQPLYLLSFDGVSARFVNHKTADGANASQLELIQKISGHNATIDPEKGQSSIGGINVSLLNRGNEITALIASDPYQWDRKKVTVKAGYVGMDEADLLTIATYWVSSIKMKSKNLIYEIGLSDPQKWMQRYIFREASEASPVLITGNPINIMLSVLMSSGTVGANGTHDYLAASNGLGLESDAVSVATLEAIRDNYYPGDSHYMRFSITEKQKAKDFIEKQICQVLSAYPAIDGQGRFFIIPFRAPINTSGVAIQTFDDDSIIDMPEWDLNLSAKINEVYFEIDANNDDYAEHDYIDSDSINARGPGSAPLKIKSDGLRTSNNPASITARGLDIISRRKEAIFARWSNPPPVKLRFKTFFSKWLAEAGDIISVSHSKVPDLDSGLMGITDRQMEIVSRSIDWDAGAVKIECLDTGFKKLPFAAIGNTATIGNFYISP